MPSKPRIENLSEVAYTDGPAPVVDRDAGVIRGVKLGGRSSDNEGGRREYSDPAFSQLAKHYAGAKVNFDHPPDRQNPGRVRDVADAAGWIGEDVEERPDGAYGTLHVIKSHPMANALFEIAERNPKRLGMSHNAEGEVDTTADGRRSVKNITKFRSLDIVQDPATVNSLFESRQEQPVKITIRQLFESAKYPLLAKALFEDDSNGMADYSEAEADAPAEDASSDDQIAAAFKSMVDAALSDESLDLKAKLAKVKEILMAQEKLTGGDDDDDESAVAEGAMCDDKDAPEKVKEAIKEARDESTDTQRVVKPKPAKKGKTAVNKSELQEAFAEFMASDPTIAELKSRAAKGDRLELRDSCRQLLESKNREVTDVRITALSSVSDGDRKSLVESWPARAKQASGTRPLASPPLLESRDDDEYSDAYKDPKKLFGRLLKTA